MSNKIAGRSVQMFRCQYDPMIGPKPLNAFVPKDMGMTATINDEATGVLVTLKTGQQHFVAFTNIQSIRLDPEVIAPAAELKSEFGTIRRGPGRPPVNKDV